MTTLDNLQQIIDDNKELSSFNRLALIHKDLPALALALGGASMNDRLYSLLEEQLTPAGSVRGRSKAKTKIKEEDEEPVDTELEYTRPNGDIYYSRKWSGTKDIDVLRAARERDMAPLLYGPPGTGKTALVEAAFTEELLTVVMTGDTDVNDLVGSFIPNPEFGKDGGESEYLWIDGPLVVAAAEGRPILLDEIGLGDPKVLSVVYGLMDGRREINVTANPSRGTIKAQPGFFVIGATNPNAPGVRLSEALLSRFSLHVEVTTDWDLAVRLGVPQKMVTVAHNLSTKMEEGLITWAPQFRELLAFRDISKLFGQDFAIANLIATCPEMDRAEVMEMMTRTFTKTILPARI